MHCAGEVRRQVGLGVALIAIGLVGFWTRLQFQTIAGGTEEYRAWSMKQYFGGITTTYLHYRDILWGCEGDWGELPADALLELAYPPGYPVFLGTLRQLGIADLQTYRMIQAFLDCFSVLAVYLLGRWCSLPSWVALVGALGYALYPMWAVGSTFLLAECFSQAFVLWILVLLVWAARRKQSLAWIPAGLVIGIASLFRPDLSLLIIPAGLWAVWQTAGWYRARALPCLALGMALIIGPWGWHNYRTQGVWVFTTTAGSAGVWEGLGEEPNDYGFVLNDAKLILILRERGMVRFSPEADRYLKKEIYRILLAHPDFVLRAIKNRMCRILFDGKEHWGPDKLCLGNLQDRADTWTGITCFLLALAVLRRNPNGLLVVGLPLVYGLMSIGLVHYEARYVRYTHLSFLFALMVLIAALWTWGRARRPRLAVALMSGFLVALVLLAVRDVRYLRRASKAARMATQTAIQQRTNGTL